MGESPYPFNDIADVHPQAPRGSADGVGDSPYSAGDWNTEVHPQVDRHDGDMDTHRGSGPIAPAKPGSF